MAHTNYWVPNGLLRKFSAEINTEEILKSNFAMHQHPEFNSIKYVINDFTEVTDYIIEKSHTKIVASTDDMISQTKGELRIAIVANQEAHIVLAKSYINEMKNNSYECRIFKTINDAQKWAES